MPTTPSNPSPSGISVTVKKSYYTAEALAMNSPGYTISATDPSVRGRLLSGEIVGYTVEMNPLDAFVIVASAASPNDLTTLVRTLNPLQVFLTNHTFNPFGTNVYFFDPARVIQASAKAPVVPVVSGYTQQFMAGATPIPPSAPPGPPMTPAEYMAKTYAGYTAEYDGGSRSAPKETGVIVGYTSLWNGYSEYVILADQKNGVSLNSYLNQVNKLAPQFKGGTLQAWLTDPWFYFTQDNVVFHLPVNVSPLSPAPGLSTNRYGNWCQEYIPGSPWTAPGRSALGLGPGFTPPNPSPSPMVLGPQNHIYQFTGNVTVQEATEYDLACKPPIDLSKFPHKCVKCGYPAYNGFASTECSNESCK